MLRRPARARDAAELLDAPVEDPAVYEESLGQVAAVNRWLGGEGALLRALARLLPAEAPARILDVGTGSAELPLRIAGWARRHGRSLRIVAADIHPRALALAHRRTAAAPSIEVAAADARALPFGDGAFDVAIHVLALHHFGEADQLRVLREMRRVSRRAVLVSELERSWPNYLGARLLAATLWRANPLTRHDAPLSVLRAFTPPELLDAARLAGLPEPRVRRHFYQRLLLESRVPGTPPPPR